MTRLTSKDIDCIANGLVKYNKQLIVSTGHGLLEIACHCFGADVGFIKTWTNSFTVCVIPVTAGRGIISDFSETVTAILSFLGISARVSPEPDVAGLAQALESGADGIFMADDRRFIALHCKSGEIVDNGSLTGKVYATALRLMAGPTSGKDILVVGCGPVGIGAAEQLMKLGEAITLVDIDIKKCLLLKEHLCQKFNMAGDGSDRLRIDANIDRALMNHDHIVDATPESSLLHDNTLTKEKKIVIPGVPPGISDYGFRYLGSNVIHDKLELGVAAMAVSLLIKKSEGVVYG